MSSIAQVQDGKIVQTSSQNSLAATVGASSNGMDKDTFLQLLVAQMKYQDPLQPTSNTEYISQYATFSQVEQMQNMAGTLELSRASQLVGQEVYVKTTNSSGESTYVQGRVDYVVYENGKAYVAIDEELYSIGDVDTVLDKKYNDAYNAATELVNRIFKLPNVNNISISDCGEIDALEEMYNGMDDYTKKFIATDAKTALEEYVAKAKEVRLAAEEAEKNKGNEENGDNPEEGDTPETEQQDASFVRQILKEEITVKIEKSGFLSIEQLQDQYLNQTQKVGKGDIGVATSFDSVLRQKLLGTEGNVQSLKFSKHAANRLVDRNITLSDNQIARLSDGARKAGEKGIQDSLVIVDELAFIVNIPNKTVITAMDQTETNENVFTNIDGAVIMQPDLFGGLSSRLTEGTKSAPARQEDINYDEIIILWCIRS